ncbi:hypothetical protein [Nostoc sp.]|uniref:hypothetical protein n=1 Tax=Nostoc sp. TaxID=1180 RepID=UPI002FF4FAFA
MIKTNRSSSLTGLPQDIGRLEALNVNDNPMETQVRIVGSNPGLRKQLIPSTSKIVKANRCRFPTWQNN